MNDPVEMTVAVHLADGEVLRFKVNVDPKSVRDLGSKIESGLAANYFGAELDGKLIIVPSHQIRKIEITPAPQVVIAHVIRKVTPA
jgi:hypothetical protein